VKHEQKLSWEEAVLSLRAQAEAKELVLACFYDDPLLGAARRYANSSEWMALRQLIGDPPGMALDIGAGRGISSYALASAGWQVTALEPNDSNIVGAGAIRQLSQDACLDIKVVQDWGEQLPFPDASFDLVNCRQVLHHAHDLRRLCAEIARVLKPGGRFVAAREHVVSRREDLPIFLAAHPLHRLYGGENAFLLSEYMDAIKDAGLSIDVVLNPKESDINLYPETCMSLKRRWAGKLGLPSPSLIPDALLRYAGRFSNVAGRLYTFAGRRPDHA
jgi:SAM-dependent methyltransferase